MPPEKDSPLESLQNRIYQTSTQPTAEVDPYVHTESSTAYGWHIPPAPLPKKRMSWAVRFLIGTGIFLVLAGLAAAFLLFHGVRSISNDRVTIDVQAPVSIASGETISLVITIHNGNPATLNGATLYAVLPDGTRAGDGTDAPRTQYTDALGDIPAGADVTRTVPVKLYGPEGTALAIPVKVEYHTEGSNALLVSTKDASVTITTSPIAVQVQTLSQTSSGQPFTLTVSVRSNASTPVDNLVLVAEYPQGFSQQKADPAPSAAGFFTIGTIQPGEQKVIKITGTLLGENADQRVFNFTAGSANPDGTNTLGSPYSKSSATIAITHPFLNVNLSLNREAADMVIASPGQNIGGMLTWQNTLTDTLKNTSIRVALSGNALDTSAIRGGTGFYRSTDGSVIFASDTNPGLAALTAGATGAGSFSFGVKSAAALAGVTSPTIMLSISVTGQHTNGNAQAESLSSTLTRTIKIGTDVSLTSTLSHASSGAGPVPPSVGTESTYTVALTAKNTVNSVGAAKVTAKLPSYVRFAGVADAGVTYNSDTSTVTWTIGDLAPNSSATANFQIVFMPSASQNGTNPTLVGEQTFTGFDRHIEQQVTDTATPLTSELPGALGSGTVH